MVDVVEKANDPHSEKLSWRTSSAKLSQSRVQRLLPAFFLAGTVAAEAVTVYGEAGTGLWMHTGLVALLVTLGTKGVTKPLSRVWLSLSFAPLIRIISMAAPLPDYPLVYWYVLTGLPLFIAAWFMARYMKWSSGELALTVDWSPGQILVGVSGLALGFVEYLILRPNPLAPASDPWAIAEAMLILLVFTGILEEVIFRGLMQQAVERVLGTGGVVYVALIFTVLHLGYKSFADLVFVFGVALYFGFYVRRTHSIFGVSLAHGLTNISLFLVFPFILQPAEPAAAPPQQGVLFPLGLSSLPTSTPFHPLQATPTPRPTRTPRPSPSPTAEATATPAPSPTPIVLLVDDMDDGFIAVGGHWWREPSAHDGDVYEAPATDGLPEAIVEWRIVIPACGVYRVEAFIPRRFAETLSARYEIGSEAAGVLVSIDQQGSQGEWAMLGEYPFGWLDKAYVRLTNATGEEPAPSTTIAFDAVRWMPVDQCRGGPMAPGPSILPTE